jgi:hypothetical protein
MRGKAGLYYLGNFPDLGDQTAVEWDQAKQNFSVSQVMHLATTVSGTYYGAVESGAHAPFCGPWPPDRVLPIKHGSFNVRVENGHMRMNALYVDGETCTLPDVALLPYDKFANSDGYVTATFDEATAALCPAFTGGVNLRVNGQRLVARSLDHCVTAIAWAAK